MYDANKLARGICGVQEAGEDPQTFSTQPEQGLVKETCHRHHQPAQTSPSKPKWKQNDIPLRTLNANPLAQFIGTDTITEALIDDVPTKVLLDTGATVDLMPINYAKAVGLEIKPLSLITGKHVTMSLAAG